MEGEAALTLGAWMKRVAEFRAGALGYVVVVLALAATAFFAFNPELFFRSLRYPRIVLMLPGLAVGASVFFLASMLTWLMRRSRG